jgi:hypothetical protein
MSTTSTPTESKATTAPAAKPQRKRTRSTKRSTTKTSAASKAKQTTNEATALAALAQAKAKPAARITTANINRVKGKLGGKKPSDVLGISIGILGELATGKRSKSSLKEPQRVALRDFGSALGSDTFYGMKLAGMLWAVEKGVKA